MDKLLTSMISLYQKRASALLGVAFVFTLACAFFASQIRIESDLRSLLPDTAPSVQGLDHLEENYGEIHRMTLILDAESDEQAREVLEFIAPVIREHERVERIEYKKPVEFFTAQRLLYVERDDLETIDKRIRKRIRYEKQQANPLFASLKAKDPPSIDFSDIEEKYSQFRESIYYHDQEKPRYLLFIFPDFPPTKLDQVKVFVEDLEGKVEARMAKEYPNVELQWTGAYKRRMDQQRLLIQDLGRAMAIAIGGLLLFLLFYFRGVVAPLVVFLPLVCGTIWSFAWAQLVFEKLNILTAFVGSVLLGLGIDYGIHIVSRYFEAREQHDPSEALDITMRSAGLASLYAGLTTVLAFGSLSASSFQAFLEFGVISLGGMGLIIFSYATVLPCALLLIANTKYEPGSTAATSFAKRAKISPSGRAPMVMGAILLVMVCASAIGMGNLHYETDFSNLQRKDVPSTSLDKEVDRILGVSQHPLIAMVESRQHASVVADELRERMAKHPNGDTIDRVMILTELLPKHQDEKLDRLKGLQEKFEKLPSRVLKKQDGLADFKSEIERLLEQGPLTPAALPQTLRAPFERKDRDERPEATAVIIFPAVPITSTEGNSRLAEVIRGLPGPRGEAETIDAIGEALLLVDIYRLVKKDSARMLVITLIGLFFVAFLAFRNLRLMALLFLILTVSIFVALGLVGVFKVEFNFINMIIFPIWLGLGVDAAFHLIMRTEESHGDLAGYLATNFAVAAAFLTSMLGFGAMLATAHPGLFSLGAVAVIGLGSILIVSILVQGSVFVRTYRDEHSD